MPILLPRLSFATELPWRPSWISERNHFSNFEYMYHCDASHQVSAHGRHHSGYRNGTILAILNLHVTAMPPTKFQLNPTYGSGEDIEKVKS